jgi:hypothetical protein
MQPAHPLDQVPALENPIDDFQLRVRIALHVIRRESEFLHSGEDALSIAFRTQRDRR